MDTKIVEVVRLVDANKAKFAFLAPLVTAVCGAIASWIESGNFNTSEIQLSISGLVLGLASAYGTYTAKAGRAVVSK